MLHYGSSSSRRRQRKALWNMLWACVLILLAWILLLMLVAPRLDAQELIGASETAVTASKVLPEVPEPHIAPTSLSVRPVIAPGASRFWDRPNRIAAVGMFSLAAADMAQTCRFLARGERERWLTQSCAANVSLTAGFTAAALLGAYALHRSGHHRLERVPMLYMTATSVRGIVMSKRWGGW